MQFVVSSDFNTSDAIAPSATPDISSEHSNVIAEQTKNAQNLLKDTPSGAKEDANTMPDGEPNAENWENITPEQLNSF